METKLLLLEAPWIERDRVDIALSLDLQLAFCYEVATVGIMPRVPVEAAEIDRTTARVLAR